MPKTPTSDLIATVAAVREISRVIEKHDEALRAVKTRLEKIEKRLTALEAMPGRTTA